MKKETLTFREKAYELFKDISFSLEKENILSTSRMAIEKKLLQIYRISEQQESFSNELKQELDLSRKEVMELRSKLLEKEYNSQRESEQNESRFVSLLVKCKQTMIKMRYPDLLNSQKLINETIDEINKTVKFK